MYDAIASELFDKLVILIGGFIFAFAFSIILWLSTKIYVSISLRKNDKKTDKAYGTYVIEATDKMISVTINEQTIAYNYKDITKFKKKRHTFFIRTADDKIGLLFKEHIIGREKYRQLLDIVSKNVSC